MGQHDLHQRGTASRRGRVVGGVDRHAPGGAHRLGGGAPGRGLPPPPPPPPPPPFAPPALAFPRRGAPVPADRRRREKPRRRADRCHYLWWSSCDECAACDRGNIVAARCVSRGDRLV